MKVYLDDTRDAPEGFERTHTVQETLDLLETRHVKELSVDNDLGIGFQEGHIVLDVLENWVHFDPTFPVPIITIHSANAARVPYMKQTAAKLELTRQQQMEKLK